MVPGVSLQHVGVALKGNLTTAGWGGVSGGGGPGKPSRLGGMAEGVPRGGPTAGVWGSPGDPKRVPRAVSPQQFGRGVGWRGRGGAEGSQCSRWRGSQAGSHRSRFGAHTMARLRTCMPVSRLRVATRAKCRSRNSSVLGGVNRGLGHPSLQDPPQTPIPKPPDL